MAVSRQKQDNTLAGLRNCERAWRGTKRSIGEERTGSLSPSTRSIRIINNPRRVWNGTRNRNISPSSGEPGDK